MKELVHNYVIYPLNCDHPIFIESRGIKNIMVRIMYICIYIIKMCPLEDARVQFRGLGH